MKTLTVGVVLSVEEAKRKAYSLNIPNGTTCSVTDGNDTTRYFEMNKGVLSHVFKPEETSYYEDQLANIKFNPDKEDYCNQDTVIKVSGYNGQATNWLTLNKESATDLVNWLDKNFIKENIPVKEESMDIYSKKGTKVIYLAIGGYPSQLEYANKFLEKGKEYTIERTDVDSWTTNVYLQEILEDTVCFNSVHFKNK